MKLGASNIAWPAENDEEALDLLPALGFAGVEVAPTKIASWDDLTSAKLDAYRRRCESTSLRICSLQAILFNRPDAKLLGDDSAFSALLEHIRKVAWIGDALGARVAVFGAPSNRKLEGRSEREAGAIAIDRFRQLGDAAGERGLTLGIEPLPPTYGGEFLTRAVDVMAFVDAVHHPHVSTHLDTACVFLAGDRIADAVRSAGTGLAHFHVSEPNLAPPTSPSALHVEASNALRDLNYQGWVVLEMREVEGRWKEALNSAARQVTSTYSVL